eukprot:TRINITY_DN1_c0_g1_i1.p1 TRINITY_DN1_c0_g1~~TRINITY_DN1_c0_g1_i1.p1  ORF type:complete len:220 (+),score=93.41 TRINITY_DN1_c0_g1_i1:74-733(+)
MSRSKPLTVENLPIDYLRKYRDHFDIQLDRTSNVPLMEQLKNNIHMHRMNLPLNEKEVLKQFVKRFNIDLLKSLDIEPKETPSDFSKMLKANTEPIQISNDQESNVTVEITDSKKEPEEMEIEHFETQEIFSNSERDSLDSANSEEDDNQHVETKTLAELENDSTEINDKNVVFESNNDSIETNEVNKTNEMVRSDENTANTANTEEVDEIKKENFMEV